MNLRLPLSLAPLALVACSYGWGALGHRQVADIAWSKLTREAKVNVAKILMFGDTVTSRDKDQPFSVPNKEITDEFLEKSVRPVFADSATWPDAIKGGKSKQFEDKIIADNLASPGVKPPASGNSGEEVRCKTWHYYDLPIAPKDFTGPTEARESNAVRALALIQKDLEDQIRINQPDKRAQAYDLYWILHIYGDLHQPLHCVANFTFDPKGDAGGNTFKTGIPSPFREGEKLNLHSYWDSGIDHAIEADPRLGKNASLQKVTETWTKDNLVGDHEATIIEPVMWVFDGWLNAQNAVYKDLKPDETPSADYIARHNALCKKQAVLAGYRLAAYLNRTLK